MNKEKMNKAMEKVFNDIDSNKHLIPKAREMNRALSNIISFNKARIEYKKLTNSNKKIEIFE